MVASQILTFTVYFWNPRNCLNHNMIHGELFKETALTLRLQSDVETVALMWQKAGKKRLRDAKRVE